MPKGEEVRSVSQQNVSPSAQGLEVKELSSGHGRSVSLDIPLYRTGQLVRYQVMAEEFLAEAARLDRSRPAVLSPPHIRDRRSLAH